MTAATEPTTDYEVLRALQEDQTVIELEGIATALGVSKVAVQKWRWKALQHVENGEEVPLTHEALPLPDAPDSKDRRPKWFAGTIYTWAMQVGRMSPEGTAQHMPRRGRPRRSLHE